MSPDYFFEFGALALGTATFGLNYADLRHRREMSARSTHPEHSSQPPAAPRHAQPIQVHAPPGAAAATVAPPPPPTSFAPPQWRPAASRPVAWSRKRRVIAFLIDYYIAILPFLLVPTDANGNVTNSDAETGAMFLVLAIWLGQLLVSATTGWTLGRRLLGGRLVDARSGGPIGVVRNTAHFALWLFSIGFLALGSFRSEERLGWHDQWTRSRFVSTRAEEATAMQPVLVAS